MTSNNLAEIRRLHEQLTRQRNVLIVEDDEFLREQVAQLLKDYGCSIDETGDGLEGMKLAETKKYDFAIIDLHLPNVHGTTICKTIKSTNPKTDIIIMTGENYLNIEGFIVVFPKPFEFSLLERQIAGLTGRPYAG